MKLFSFFFPKKIAEAHSLFNGKIEVIEQFGKRAIKVQGLEQSGPIVEKIWQKGIKEITNYQLPITSILILGLGGGSAVKVIKKYFPTVKILGIEIDPAMVKLGKKYLGLGDYHNLKIQITDAFKWIHNSCLNGSNHFKKFDLILVDLFLGRKVPRKAEGRKFLTKIKKLLTSEGIVIFNRLRKKEDKFRKFLDKLKKMYHHIKVVKPVANYLIICQ